VRSDALAPQNSRYPTFTSVRMNTEAGPTRRATSISDRLLPFFSNVRRLTKLAQNRYFSKHAARANRPRFPLGDRRSLAYTPALDWVDPDALQKDDRPSDYWDRPPQN
jgi:hypothetical protein